MARYKLDGAKIEEGPLGTPSAPGAVNTSIYTAPIQGAKDIELTVSNTAGTAGSFRVWRVPSGSSVATATNLKYDVPIAANAGMPVWVGSLHYGDAIWVYGSANTIAFSLTGKAFT